MQVRNLSFRSRLLLGLILGSWVALIVPLGAYVSLAAGIVSIALAVRWRKAFPLLVVAISPMAFGLTSGVTEWFSARPRFQYMGLQGLEFSNLDRETRCYAATGGCLVNGDEWVTQGSHNLGLRLMTALFGAPPATYHGGYPTRDEARRLTDGAEITPIEMFLNGSVLIDGKAIELGSNTAADVISDLELYIPEEAEYQVRSALFQQSCVMLRVKGIDAHLDRETNGKLDTI